MGERQRGGAVRPDGTGDPFEVGEGEEAPTSIQEPEKDSMPLSNFLVIAVSLLALWALGFFVFHIGGSLIHILLVVAVVSFALHFVLGRA